MVLVSAADLDRLEAAARQGCSLCNGTGNRHLPAPGRVVPCGIAHSADPVIGVRSSDLAALIARLREAEDAMNVCARCGEAIDAEVAAERSLEASLAAAKQAQADRKNTTAAEGFRPLGHHRQRPLRAP